MIVSGLLALYFLVVGVNKAFASAEALQAMTNGIPVIMLQIAGFAEIVGAVGLIVPAATRILPILTPIAAALLSLTLLAAFVAWARFAGPAQVAPRASSPEVSAA